MLFVCCVFYTQPAAAQDDDHVERQKEIFKERKTMSKMTRKQVSNSIWRQAKRQAKVWKKEGWKASPGTPSLEQQMSDVLMCQYELDGEFPRYILGRSSAVSATYALARRQAIARARVDIASSIQTEVTELIETSELNIELSSSEVESVGKMLASGRQLVQQSLGRTNVVFEAFREFDGKIEVMVNISYDGRAAKNTVLKLIERENGEIGQKMGKLLGNSENE